MKRIVFLGSACALIAACSSGETDTDGDGKISNAEMAAVVEKSDIKPTAGQYRATAELVSVDIPGAPEGIAEMMKTNMKAQTSEYCLTQEDADKGFEEMAKESQNGDCTMQSFDINGGDIDAKMSCVAGGQGEMNITMDGSGTSTSMDMQVTMEGSMPGMGAAKLVLRSKSERIGDCS